MVVAKADRLTCSLAFLSRLLEAGVEVRLPAIERPTGPFMLQQMAAVAELEAESVSAAPRQPLPRSLARG